MMKHPKQHPRTYFTRGELWSRGWSYTMMRRFLGKPDFHDLEHGPRDPAYYYLRRRVREAERTDEFLHARDQEAQHRAKECDRTLMEMTGYSELHKPSEVTSIYFLHADRLKGKYPAAAERSGKWLIFVPVDQVDEAWEKVKRATEEGLLGGSAKVATAKPNANAADPSVKVICVYTYDSDDQADVRRVRNELRKLGFTKPMPYKTDEATYAGHYAVKGNRRISKYYE